MERPEIKFVKSKSKRVSITLDEHSYKMIKHTQKKFHQRFKNKKVPFSKLVRFIIKQYGKGNISVNQYQNLKILILHLTNQVSKLYREQINGYNNFNQLTKALNQINKHPMTVLPSGEITKLRKLTQSLNDIKENPKYMKIMQKEMTNIWLSLK